MELSLLEPKISCLNLWFVVSTGSWKPEAQPHALQRRETLRPPTRAFTVLFSDCLLPYPRAPGNREPWRTFCREANAGGTERLIDWLSAVQPGSCRVVATIKPREFSVLKRYRKHQGRKNAEEVGKMWDIFLVLVPPPLPTKSSSLFHIPASSSQPSRFLKNLANLLLPEVTPKQSLTSSGGCPALARIGVRGGGQRGNGRQKGQHSKGRKAWRVGGVEAALYSWGEVSAGAERDLRRKRQGSEHRGLVLHLGGSQ